MPTIRPVSAGFVTATAKPLHLGVTSQSGILKLSMIRKLTCICAWRPLSSSVVNNIVLDLIWNYCSNNCNRSETRMNYWYLKRNLAVLDWWSSDRPIKLLLGMACVIIKRVNMMRDEMQVGDQGFFYHSSCNEPGIVVLVKIVKAVPWSHTIDLRPDHLISTSYQKIRVGLWWMLK